MSYELSKLEKLIQSAAYQKEVNEEGILPDEVIRIKNVWQVIACSELDAGFLKNYVRQHQLGLISIAEAISGNASDIPDAFSTIEGLQYFLLQSFPEFLDYGLAIPAQSLSSLKESWQKDLSVFESQLKLIRVSEAFSDASLKPIRLWLQVQPLQSIRYYRLHFFIELQTTLREFIDAKNPPGKATGILIDKLCHINFNSLLVYEAIKRLITEKASAKEDMVAEIEFLRSMHEHFRRLPVRNDVYYKPDGRIMARTLADWLQRQVKAKEAQHHTLFVEETPVTEEEMAETGKIMTTLSIEELALIIRLFIETAVFRVKRNALTALTRFMARYVRTVSKGVYDEYKPETLYKYIYSISLVTLRSVQNILKRMLRKLDAIETLIKSGKPIPPPNRR